MKVTSSAALATLTVSPKELQSDTALQLVVALASKLQLTVQQPNKGTLGLALPSGRTLSQRNAILRCLAGMGLHNALDDMLLGGHGKAAGASPHHAMALASLSSWMSVADHYRSPVNQPTIGDLLSQLESHLESRAFLIPSSVPTLCDVDVAATLLLSANNKDSSVANMISECVHVPRWLNAVGAMLTKNGIDSLKLPSSITTSEKGGVEAQEPPMFFFGDEEGVELPIAKKSVVPSKRSEAPTKEQGGKKDSQQKQQQQQQQQQPAKKAKGGGGKQPPAADNAAATMNISALDIRVGKILKAWPHPEAEKLYCEEIDVGEEKPRQIASGLRPFYDSADDLVGKTVMVLCNLKQRNLVGFPSHGMVMCASNADHTSVETMEPPANAAIGERIMFEGYEDGEPEPENKVAKKKIVETLAPDLKTNADGICVWKEAVSKTSGGPVKASKGMANAHVA